MSLGRSIQKELNVCFMLSILLNDEFTFSHYTFTRAFLSRCNRIPKESTFLKFD